MTSISFQDFSDKSNLTSGSNNYDITRKNYQADNESMPRNSLGERVLSSSSHQNLENYYTVDDYMNATLERTYKMLQSQKGNRGVPQGDSLSATINNNAQKEVIYTSNSAESCEQRQGRVYLKGGGGYIVWLCKRKIISNFYWFNPLIF